jgi:hypothetical protein
MSKNNIIKINAEFDIDLVKESVEKAKDLNDNEELFEQLVGFEKIKKQASDILDQIKSVEDDVKGLIKTKANALYGNEWEAIKGHNYKITKSPTGSVFNIDGKPQKKFLVIKESINTKEVNTYIKEKGKLPVGIDYNGERGSSIRITVHQE